MGSQQQFCLRWNNHQTNMLNVFDHLLQSETLVDVTLACDGLSLRAHKVVLSACSPYFQALFAENPCKHPIVILKDIPYSELRALVHFMYKGEVNVSQEKLPALLKTAEHLKVKGLSEVTQANHNGGVETTMTAANRHVPTMHHIEALPVGPRSPSPQVQPSSPGPPQRKKPCQRDTSDSLSPGGGSDLDESDSLNLHGSPEVLEARVDLPQNMEDDITQDDLPQPEQMPNKPYGPASPMETKDHLVSHSPRQEDTNSANRFGGEPSYPPHDAGVMVASLPSTSTFQNSQDSVGDEIKEPTIKQEREEEVSDPNDDDDVDKRLGPSWSPKDMACALEEVQSGRLSMSKAAATYGIPTTTLWQRARREGIESVMKKGECSTASGNSGVGWTDSALSLALEAVRTGQLSINKAAYTYGIPNTTLWQRSRKEGIDTSRTSAASAHACSWTEEDLKQALDAVRAGHLSVNRASSTFGIPSTTLWTRARRHGIETTRRPVWDAERDETLVQAIRAVRSGNVSMTQASMQFNVPYTTLWKHSKK